MKTAVIYHDNCPDGWCAAWVAYNALKSDGPPTLMPATHGTPPPELDGYDTVYIVDFSYSHDELVTMSRGRRVTVLDHHQTAIDNLAQGDSAGHYGAILDADRSGAGITWDFFHIGEDRPDIVNYVEDRDLWRFDLPQSREVNAYIRTQPYEIGVWEDINQLLSVDQMADVGRGVLLHIDAYCRAAAGHAYWCEMGDRTFPIVNITYESCSEVANYMLDHFGTDMAGYFFQRGDGAWQYGFRSRNGVTVNDFAESFGGGGHPQASGCQSPELLHRRTYTANEGDR